MSVKCIQIMFVVLLREINLYFCGLDIQSNWYDVFLEIKFKAQF